MSETTTPMRHVIAALVTNEPGVLAHVAGMFAARGFNIDSLVVGRTENPRFSRMTIVVSGNLSTVEQVRKQLGKLVEVVKVVDYLGTDFVDRDLMLVRVKATAESRRQILELTEMFRGKTVDVGHDQIMIELSGREEKLEGFIDLLQPYGIVELARTGVIAMPRSERVEGQGLVMRPGISRMASPEGGSGTGTVESDDDSASQLPPG